MKFIKHPHLGISAAVLDMENLKDQFSNEELESLEFSLKGYTKIAKSDEVWHWNIFFGHPNKFLESLDDEEKVKLAKFLIRNHQNAATYADKRRKDRKKVPNFIQDVGFELNDIDEELNLVPRLTEYVRNNITMADFSDAGTKIQHKPELTWLREDAIQLTSYIILSKIMAALVSSISTILEASVPDEFRTEVRPVYLLNIFVPVFQKRHPTIYKGINYYIDYFIHQKSDEKARSIMVGTTINSSIRRQIGIVMVRNFVNAELDKDSGCNPMTFLYRGIKAASEQTNANSAGGIYQVRNTSAWRSDDGEEMSVLDANSVITNDPLYIRSIVRGMLPTVINRLYSKYNLDPEMIEEAAEFYKRSPFPVGFTTESLIAGVFGSDMGGGFGVRYLSFLHITKMAAMVQALCFTKGLFALGHFITAKKSEVAYLEYPTEVARLLNNVGTSPEYRRCEEHYTTVSEDVWRKNVQYIINEIVERSHYYNTAENYWKLLSHESMNGSKTEVVSTFSRELSIFFLEYCS